MTRDQAKEFAEQFTKSFCSPFLPDGFVTCSIFEYKGRTSVVFDIGDRNVAFDAEKMEWYGQDTASPQTWLVERIKHPGTDERAEDRRLTELIAAEEATIA